MKRVLLMVLALTLVAWAARADPIVIGAVYNLTGSQAGLDVPSARGARLAVSDLNAGGGIRGHRLRLRLEDGQSDPAVIARKTRDILHDDGHTRALIGLSDTDMVLAAAPEAAAFKRLFVTSGATSPRLPEQVPTYLYLACFGDNVQAAAAAEWAYEQGHRKVRLVVDEEMEYTRLLSGYFKARFVELGGQLTEDGADLVFLAVGPEAAQSKAAELRSAGFSGPILGGDSLDLAGWQVDQVYFTTHAFLDRHPEFVQRYTEVYGEPPDAFSALGYDTMMLLASAMVRAGSFEPERIRKAMADTREFSGLTGRLAYDEGQRIPRKSVFLVEISGGKRKLVREVVPQKVPAPQPR
ncbi:MAG: branched-chain amino acid ABC transporter substrate-binding protein [Candidatus Xenobia bacterium]